MRQLIGISGRHGLLFWVTTAGAALLCVLSAAAQQSQDLSEASLEELVEMKVYTASKHTQSIGDAPASVTVITAEEIRKYGYRTLGEALRSVRGFYVSSDRMYEYLGVRGFGRLGDYNTRVLLLVDGHRLNDAIYDQAMLGTEFSVDLDLVSRIEVIRGPTSSLYGSNAFFAVINVITKSPQEAPGLELSFEPGSFGTYKGRASYAGSSHGIDGLFSATISDSAGPKLFFPEFNSPATNNGMTEATNDRYHDLLFTAKHGGLSIQAVDGKRFKGLPTGAYGTEFSDTRNSFTDQHQYMDISYRGKRGHDIEFLARAYYDRYGFDGTYVYPESGINLDYVRSQTWGSELQVSHEWGLRHRISVGTEIRHNFQQDLKNYDLWPAAVYLDISPSSWVWAGFAQYEYSIRRQLTFTGGFRHDRYSIYGGTTNPRMGLIYKPRPSTSLKFLYGRAFRAPNVYEAFYGSGLNNSTGYKIVPGLGPESLQSFEGVWEQAVGENLQITAGVYHNGISRVISVQRDPKDGLLYFANVDAAKGMGMELEAEAHINPRLQTKVSYTYGDVDDAHTDLDVVNSPHHLGKINVTGTLVRDRLFGSLDAQYTSFRFASAGPPLAAYPVFNGTLLATGIGRNLDVSASLYNIFDRKYFDPTSPELPVSRLQSDGRSLRIKLTWHLGRPR